MTGIWQSSTNLYGVQLGMGQYGLTQTRNMLRCHASAGDYALNCCRRNLEERYRIGFYRYHFYGIR